MEEEIDLRKYIEVLIHYWYWIVGLGVAAAVMAALWSTFMLTPMYEATALVVVTKPRYVMDFASGIQAREAGITPTYAAFPDLAISDDMLLEVLDTLDPLLSPPGNSALQKLKGMIEATPGQDPSLVELRVRSADAEEAARIANTWAKLFVAQTNALYGEGADQLAYFESELGETRANLEAAEQAIIEFQALDDSGILDAQLSSINGAQVEFLNEQQSIERDIQDIQVLRAQLATQPGDSPAGLADDLTALSIQARALNAAISSVQLQVEGGESLSGRTTGEIVAFLDELVVNLEAKSQQIEKRAATLNPEILDLQRRIQGFATESSRLSRHLDLTEATYLTLARKVEESRIASQGVSDNVKIASQAFVPSVPVSPRRLFNTAIAGVLGVMFAVLAVFVVEYWRQDPLPNDEPRQGVGRGG